MATEQDLAGAVRDYIAQATLLEKKRQALVDRIMEVVRTEIVPKLSPLLSDGYGINSDAISVHSVGENPRPYDERNVTHGTVPTGFYVYLELLYDGKPLTYHESESVKKIVKIQDDLKSKLEELANQFNLNVVLPVGEPYST